MYQYRNWLKAPQLALVFAMALVGCKGTASTTPASDGGNPQSALVVPSASSGEPITGPRAEFYKGAFPAAEKFESRPIPPEMVRELDKDNTTYVVAYNALGEKVGYLRDISAPMTLDADCPCNPLTFTLAFDAEMMLLKLLSAAPLEKSGHQPLSDADADRLLQIATRPSDTLLGITDPKLLVDGSSGATRKEYQGAVVLDGAFTTWRVAGLARETQRILAGAPISRDSKRLEKVLASQTEAGAQALALAAFIPTAESEPFAQQALRTMVRAYLGSLLEGGKPLPAVEERILNPKLSVELSTIETLYACQGFAAENIRPELQKACLKKLESAAGMAQYQAEMGLLRGTVAYYNKDYATAAQGLSLAASAIDPHLDANMHLRLVNSLLHIGQKDKACAGAKGLYLIHPKHAELEQALQACPQNVGELKAELDAHRRNTLLSSKLGDSPAQVLHVTQGMKDITLKMGDDGKLTLLVFFATWCPHCQEELPHLVDFQSGLVSNTKLKDKVKLLGVRTAIERENESYVDFQKRFNLNFPVYTDPALSLVFSKFMQAHGKKPGLPTLALVDGQGVVRYFMEAGEHRDIEEEVLWAIDSLL